MGDFSMEMQRIGLWCTVAQMVINQEKVAEEAIAAADKVVEAFDNKFNPQGKVNNV